MACLRLRGWFRVRGPRTGGTGLAFLQPSTLGTGLASSFLRPRPAGPRHPPAHTPLPQSALSSRRPPPGPTPRPARPRPADGHPAQPGTPPRAPRPRRPTPAARPPPASSGTPLAGARPVPIRPVFHGKEHASPRRWPWDGHLRACLQEGPFLGVKQQPEGVCPSHTPEARGTTVEPPSRALSVGTALATRARVRRRDTAGYVEGPLPSLLGGI